MYTLLSQPTISLFLPVCGWMDFLLGLIHGSWTGGTYTTAHTKQLGFNRKGINLDNFTIIFRCVKEQAIYINTYVDGWRRGVNKLLMNGCTLSKFSVNFLKWETVPMMLVFCVCTVQIHIKLTAFPSNTLCNEYIWKNFGRHFYKL